VHVLLYSVPQLFDLVLGEGEGYCDSDCICLCVLAYLGKHSFQGCATTVYGYTVRYGNTAYSRIYTVLDRTYGKIRYGVRYGPNFESLSQKIKIELCFSSANG